ncbi:MAG: hypothetical protein ING25_10980 [Burkholderiales bacterium]|nr:hypothetical protein [Burkholderiales bacterium]
MRLATKLDLPSLLTALTFFAEQVKGQPEHYTFAKGHDLNFAYAQLTRSITKPAQGEVVLFIDGYMVFTMVVQPWYGGQPFLQEWFTIKVGPSINGTLGVVAVLQAFAKGSGLRGVLGGDSSPVSIMAKAYEQSGFVPLTKVYFKETQDGIHSTGSSQSHGG